MIVIIKMVSALVLAAIGFYAPPQPVPGPVTPLPVTHPLMTWRQQHAQAAGQDYNVYSENGGVYDETLSLTEQGSVFAPAFRVVRVSPASQWIYPNIGQGAEHGMTPHSGSMRKTWLPVQANHDGNPVTSVHTALHSQGTWAAGYDLWFEPNADTSGQQQGTTGTELMVWTAARWGSHQRTDAPGVFLGPVRLDGRAWNVYASRVTQHGSTWNRIYFVPQKSSTSFSGALNPFISVALGDGYVRSSDYLTGVEYGIEILKGGPGLAVDHYSLSGISNSPAVNEVPSQR